MQKRICTRCGMSYPYNSTCPNGCVKKRKAISDKRYDRTKRKRSKIYWSNSWKTLTNICKNKFKALDLYALYVEGVYRYGDLSHHIDPIEDNPDKTFDLDNLIYVSYATHTKIHKEYDKSPKDKKNMQELLLSLVKRWEEENTIE